MSDKNLKIEYVDIGSLKPYKNNAKLHPKRQIEQIATSIEDNEFNNPIAVWNNEIVSGHGRYLAAKKLKMKKVPIIRLDHLTETQARAYALIDNQTTAITVNDIEKLSEEITRLENEGLDLSIYEFDIDLDEDFSIDDIDEVNGYDIENGDNEFFTATLTFPAAKKSR